jgi:hypothetical protein
VIEEIDAVLKSGGNLGQIYRTAILQGAAADPIRNAYMTVADKYQVGCSNPFLVTLIDLAQDVLTLEASVAELHQMFLDFALLTERQGELLDQIEYQVKSASDYIDDGNVDIVQAIEYQKSIRWVIVQAALTNLTGNVGRSSAVLLSSFLSL